MRPIGSFLNYPGYFGLQPGAGGTPWPAWTGSWDPLNKDSIMLLSSSNKVATRQGAFGFTYATVMLDTSHVSGKWYFELVADLIGPGGGGFAAWRWGFGNGTPRPAHLGFTGQNSVGHLGAPTADVFTNGIGAGSQTCSLVIAQGVRIGVYTDIDLGLHWITNDGITFHGQAAGPAANPNTGVNGLNALQIVTVSPVFPGFTCSDDLEAIHIYTTDDSFILPRLNLP